MFKILIVLKKLIFMDNNDIRYDSFTLTTLVLKYNCVN